jgi:type I restriction enzyme S subunit
VSQWRKQTIADIAAPSKNALVGGPFGSNLVSRDYTPSGVPVIRGQNMGFGRWVSGEFVFISEDKAEDLSANIARPGDLVFTQRGTLGQVAIVPPASFDRYIISQSQMKLTVDPAKADTKFLFYFFTSEEQQDYIRRNAIQTGVPHTNLGHLRTTPLLLPPLPEQRAIAAVLGALDDKIELNRRMNETLEALAQSLFKSWFVDATQSALPKGWREVPFTDTVEILGGGTPKTSVAEYWDGDIPWFSVVDSPQDSDLFVIDTEKKITKAGVENSSTQVLPVGTTIITARGTVGKIALVGVPMAMNQSCYGLRGKAGKKGFHTYFVTRALVSQLQQHAHGSVFDTITRDTLAGVQVALPPAAVVEQFEERVSPLMERIRNNLHESRTLTALRDALLPKLLSGELRVPAAAKLVEATA